MLGDNFLKSKLTQVFILATFISLGACLSLPPDCPDNELSSFPDYSNCTKYWICDQGEPVPFECHEGKHYDEVTHSCMDPQDALCRAVDCLEGELTAKPHPEMCDRYFICDFGEVVEWKCDEGLHFNEYLHHCTDPVEALCDIDLLCPNDTLQTLPHPYNCTKYFICDMSSAIVRECPAGQHYSPELHKCVDWELAGCSLCPDEGLLNVAHPTNCSKYYLCNDGESVEMDCPEGEHFSETLSHCVPAEEAGCEKGNNTTTVRTTDFPSTSTTEAMTETTTNPSTPTTEEPVPSTTLRECGEDDIYYEPHPTDCTKYYICFKGDLQIAECPEGTHYNPTTSQCDDPETAGCELRAFHFLTKYT